MRLFSKIQKSGSLHTLPSKHLFCHGKSSTRIRPFASIAGLRHNGKHPNSSSHLISVLLNSKSLPSLSMAKMAHCFILRSRLEFDLFISNNLLHAYWSGGSVRHACRLFNGMPIKDVVSWNTIISGLVRSGFLEEAFGTFCNMMEEGIRPSQSSFVSLLVAAVEMPSSMSVLQAHGLSLKSGFSSDCCVGNALLSGYVEFGEHEDLRKLPEDMCHLDVISYEILLRGYTRHESFDDAFELFKYSCRSGEHFNVYAVSSFISLCTVSLQCIDCGIQIHGHVIKIGLDLDVSVVNSLISMYARSRTLWDAKRLFELCALHDIVTWNSLISGCAYNGEGDSGLGLFGRLLSSGIRMNLPTFLSFLSCCASITSLENAKKAHCLILKLRDHIDQGSDNIILTMYCRCQRLKDAVTVFKAMEFWDTVSFNLMMGLYRCCGNYEESLRLFLLAQVEDLSGDKIMLAGAISSCSKLGLTDVGRSIHGCIIKLGFDKVSYLKTCLLAMHSQGEMSDDMENVFKEIEEPDTFSWNTLILGYAHCGLLGKVIGVWKVMETSCIMLNEFSYSALLDACSCFKLLLTAEQIQACIQKKGLIFDTALMNSSLTTYSNCQMMEKALAVFKEISLPDSISWNAMVAGYAQNGFAEDSIKFYTDMNTNGVETNDMTFASICMSCALLADLKLGLQCHNKVIKTGFESSLPVSNSLITMYSKCGDIGNSSKIFHGIANKDVITWNSIISAYAHHGCGRDAIDKFVQMNLSGLKPNHLTFVGLLSACSRAGLVSEACELFKSMYACYAIAPKEEHYACMVDILCRAGRLTEAKELIESMPLDHCSLVWKTLLSACKATENVKLGETAARRIMHLEPNDSSAYVLLSDLYASVGKRNNKVETRRLMKEQGVKKEVGCSWILN